MEYISVQILSQIDDSCNVGLEHIAGSRLVVSQENSSKRVRELRV